MGNVEQEPPFVSWVKNKYVSIYDGSITSDNRVFVTTPIEVKAGTNISFYGSANTAAMAIVAYYANSKDGVAGTGIANPKNYSLTVTADCTVRLTCSYQYQPEYLLINGKEVYINYDWLFDYRLNTAGEVESEGNCITPKLAVDIDSGGDIFVHIPVAPNGNLGAWGYTDENDATGRFLKWIATNGTARNSGGFKIPNDITFIRTSLVTSGLDDTFLKSSVTGKYIFKGKNV